MKTDNNKYILNISDVATIFNVEEPTVREWAKKKLIPAYKIGKKWFFNRARILEKQSIDDTIKIFGDKVKFTSNHLFDIFIENTRVEIKSSICNFRKNGNFYWHFSNLHKPENSDFYLFLCYNEDRTTLLRVYRVPTLDLKTNLKPKKYHDNFNNRSVVINNRSDFFDKYNVYLNKLII